MQVFELNPWKAWSAVAIAVISFALSEALISGEWCLALALCGAL